MLAAVGPPVSLSPISNGRPPAMHRDLVREPFPLSPSPRFRNWKNSMALPVCIQVSARTSELTIHFVCKLAAAQYGRETRYYLIRSKVMIDGKAF
jgi:hypothetical protein